MNRRKFITGTSAALAASMAAPAIVRAASLDPVRAYRPTTDGWAGFEIEWLHADGLHRGFMEGRVGAATWNVPTLEYVPGTNRIVKQIYGPKCMWSPAGYQPKFLVRA